MSVPFWGGDLPEEHGWNFVWLGDALLPGVATVTCKKERSVDVKKRKGDDGAELEDTGYEPAQVTIKLKITNADEWAAWQEVRPKFDPQKAGGLRQPLAILHPEPNAMDVNEVYVTSIEGDPPTARSGKLITIECLQWFPAPKPAKTSKTAKQKEGGGDEARKYAALQSLEWATNRAQDLQNVWANNPTPENERRARQAAAEANELRREVEREGLLPNVASNVF